MTNDELADIDNRLWYGGAILTKDIIALLAEVKDGHELKRQLREERDEARALARNFMLERNTVQVDKRRLQEGIEEFANYQDAHEPGPWVIDGPWRDPNAKTQVCADENCAEYWPCSSAKVIALLDDEVGDDTKDIP